MTSRKGMYNLEQANHVDKLLKLLEDDAVENVDDFNGDSRIDGKNQIEYQAEDYQAEWVDKDQSDDEQRNRGYLEVLVYSTIGWPLTTSICEE